MVEDLNNFLGVISAILMQIIRKNYILSYLWSTVTNVNSSTVRDEPKSEFTI